ncbi:MAG: transcription antitermination factor NusB [Acutalibacteraceae bacterium]|nr:transcription antitermination factor NusB [Acutalibacteraceae bacterium]
MTRRQAREQAFILLFEKSFNTESSVEELLELAKELAMFEDDEFSSKLIHTACDNIEQIDEYISNNSKGWKINRISKVALAVIRLALAEILYIDDIPDGVTVNEAVELAKKYSTPEDASFINGLLGTVVRAK